MIKIPAKVKVGYRTYTVRVVDEIVGIGGDVCYGVCNQDTETITVSSKYPVNQQECSFLHELLHGIDAIYNLDLSENQVNQLAVGLYTTFLDNPEVTVNA